MLVQERQIPATTSRCNWVNLTVVNRAFEHEYFVLPAVRSKMVDIERNGSFNLAEIELGVPEDNQDFVSK